MGLAPAGILYGYLGVAGGVLNYSGFCREFRRELLLLSGIGLGGGLLLSWLVGVTFAVLSSERLRVAEEVSEGRLRVELARLAFWDALAIFVPFGAGWVLWPGPGVWCAGPA